jgi:hypothetical protein
MLELRPNCECCDRDLPPDSTDALICSFECTYCRACASTVLAGRCPSCDGELAARPRPQNGSRGRVAAQMLPNVAFQLSIILPRFARSDPRS